MFTTSQWRRCTGSIPPGKADGGPEPGLNLCVCAVMIVLVLVISCLSEAAGAEMPASVSASKVRRAPWSHFSVAHAVARAG